MIKIFENQVIEIIYDFNDSEFIFTDKEISDGFVTENLFEILNLLCKYLMI